MTLAREPLLQFDTEDVEKYRQDLRLELKDALASHAIDHVIGISGDADPSQQARTEQILEEFVSHFQGKNYAILTGGTEGGVPQLGVEVAKRLDLPTVGVFPKQGRKYALLHSLDIAIQTSSPDIGEGIFGTETPAFVNMLDGATVIGGSYGTLTEVTTILKTNVKRARDRARNVEGALPPVYFAPIAGSGGAADLAYSISRDLGGDLTSSMPDTPTTSGYASAQFIEERLG